MIDDLQRDPRPGNRRRVRLVVDIVRPVRYRPDGRPLGDGIPHRTAVEVEARSVADARLRALALHPGATILGIRDP